MKTLYYNDLDNFCEDVFTDCEVPTSVIAKYKDAREIIPVLFFMGYEIGAIDIEPDDYDYCEPYNAEYSIMVNDGKIYCEKVVLREKCLWDGSEVSYLMSDVNSKFIDRFEKENCKLYEVMIGDEEDTNDSATEYYCDDDLVGFTVNKNTSNGYSSFSYHCSPELVGPDGLKSLVDKVASLL